MNEGLIPVDEKETEKWPIEMQKLSYSKTLLKQDISTSDHHKRHITGNQTLICETEEFSNRRRNLLRKSLNNFVKQLQNTKN